MAPISLLATLALAALSVASPRPPTAPASLQELWSEAVDWTFEMKPRIGTVRGPYPVEVDAVEIELAEGEEPPRGGLVMQGNGADGTVRAMTKWDFTDCGPSPSFLHLLA